MKKIHLSSTKAIIAETLNRAKKSDDVYDLFTRGSIHENALPRNLVCSKSEHLHWIKSKNKQKKTKKQITL
jgi:hypothetical protein